MSDLQRAAAGSQYPYPLEEARVGKITRTQKESFNYRRQLQPGAGHLTEEGGIQPLQLTAQQ